MSKNFIVDDAAFMRMMIKDILTKMGILWWGGRKWRKAIESIKN